MEIRAGEIVGLIGPNGAGKTSFIDAITGLHALQRAPSSSTARRSTACRPHGRARRGLVRTWQSVELFHDLSVRHNVQVSTDVGHDVGKLLRDAVRPEPAACRQSVDDAIELLRLGDVAERKPSELSLGRQKLVGVARALALRPHTLLLDEPAAGLDTAESAEFGRLPRGHRRHRRRLPPRRPRHAPDDGRLRPHLRHRVRSPDRRRHARTGACSDPAVDRRLPRRRPRHGRSRRPTADRAPEVHQ